MEGRHLAARTNERTLSVLRTHVPQVGRVAARKDRLHGGAGVGDCARQAAGPGHCRQVLRSSSPDPALRNAVPAYRRGPVRWRSGAEHLSTTGRPPTTISKENFFGSLLPSLPVEHRALVALAAGAGLRWGECAGLPWGAIDVDRAVVSVVQVAVATAGSVTVKPYPKTRAGVRAIPMPAFLVQELREHRFLTVAVWHDRDGHRVAGGVQHRTRRRGAPRGPRARRSPVSRFTTFVRHVAGVRWRAGQRRTDGDGA
jgi:hypothetical protein